MHSLVRDVATWTGVTLGLLLLSSAITSAQDTGQSAVRDEPSELWSTSNLSATSSRGYRLEITTEAGFINHAMATLTFENQTWRVTDYSCEAFRTALNTFQALPRLRPGPLLLQPGASPHNQLPPRRQHGEHWIIRTRLYAPDWSSIDVEMRGRQGPYAHWMTDTVAIIQSCGPPVAPAGPLP
jgi:hypothetical protein